MSQFSKTGSQINSRAVNNTENLQQQIYKEQEKQAQAEILYYIYSDLQNLINLIQSRKAVLEYFKNDPNHGMITQSNNKLILQLNLSSGIHLDQSQQYQKHPQLLQFLQNERKNAYKILEEVIDNNDQLLNGNQNNNDARRNYLQEYKKQYAKQEFQFNNQFQLQDTKQVAKFDEGVLQKMISSIQNVDSQVDQIRKNKYYKVPEQNEIRQKANEYYDRTQLQLKKNFPIQNPQDNEMQIENSTNNNPINNDTYNNPISEKQELINYLIFSGFFNHFTIQCNSSNVLQEWIKTIKYELINTYSQQNWFKEFLYQKEQFEFHCKLYYFFSIYFEYQQYQHRCDENQKIQLFTNCLDQIGKQPRKHKDQFFEYLKKNQEQKRINCQELAILQKESNYIYELYQRFCDKRN